MFFNVSDYFFTDYKWDEVKLIQSSFNAGEQLGKLITGIDIFGRGSFMGGKFNTCLGV